jgi:hypothetical protein
MPQQSAPDVTVLQGLRLKGPADVATLARLVDLPEHEVQSCLDTLAADGLAVHRQGALSGWTLTPAGRVESQRRVAQELDRSALRDAMQGAYAAFLTLNQDLLEICTRWQVRQAGGSQALNDHSDPEYDRTVLDGLRRIDAGVQPICRELAAHLARFGSYGPRFAAALERLARGELEWFTRPVIDSYHTVWFELHEDLLSTLGLERAGEGVRR